MAGAGGEAPLTTSAVLYAAARRIETQCATENLAFVECKAKDDDPAECAGQGKAVQVCVVDVLKDLARRCPNEFDGYSACLGRQAAEEYMFDRCRNEQYKLEDCACGPEGAAVAASPNEAKSGPDRASQ